MVLHDQYPWDRERAGLKAVGDLEDDDFVVLFAPRNPDVLDFIRRVKAGERPPARPAPPDEAREPVAPYPPVQVREQFRVLPRLEALAVVKGEHACTNDDLIRNGAYSWSPMTAEDISRKTGIEARMYTERGLDEISLEACERALSAAGREPEEIGAVIFCSCTSAKLIPSVATWLSGQLGIFQTHASFDLIAACAGFAYGLSAATRLLPTGACASTASSPPAPSRAATCPRARSSRSPTPCAAGTSGSGRRTSSRRSCPGSSSSGAGRRSPPSGSTCRGGLSLLS